MKAAFYECDITPPLGEYLIGYYRPRYAEDVDSRLYAKAVVIENEGEYAAIVAVDTCHLNPEVHDIVTKRIYEYTGIEPSRVCISSNHTHTGAPVHDDLSAGYKVNQSYLEVFYKLTADAVILAYKRLQECDAEYATETVEGLAHCRNFLVKGGDVETRFTYGEEIIRPLGEADDTLSVIAFSNNGKKKGAIISYALHSDTLGSNVYSGDYASVLSEKLKEEYGNDFVSVFLIGTCGDINHINIMGRQNSRSKCEEIGEKLALGTMNALKHSEPVCGEIACIKEKITIANRTMDKGSILKFTKESNNLMHIRNLLLYDNANQKTESTMFLQGIKIGDVCICALPGEIYVDIGHAIKRNAPFKKCIVVENCNSELGYVPTRNAFDGKNKVYECSLCFHSCLVPEAGEIIAEKMSDIIGLLAGGGEHV